MDEFDDINNPEQSTDNLDLLKQYQDLLNKPSAEVAPIESDNRLKEALDAQNKMNLNANLLRSFQQMVQAGGSGYKADSSVADALQKQASHPVESYKMVASQEAAAQKAKQEAEKQKMADELTKMKLKEYQIKMEDTQMGRDPNSKISKATQDIYKNYAKMMNLPYDENSVNQTSGDELLTLMPHVQRGALEYLQGQRQEKTEMSRQKREDERLARLDAMEERRIGAQVKKEEQQDKQYRQQQINTARGLLKDDPRFKKSMEQSMEFDSVDELLKEAEKGNQQAVGAIGTKLARAMGEVGVLTDTDVTRYVAGQSWGRKLEDWFKKGATGELSPDTIKGIKSNLTVLKEKLNSDRNKIYNNAASRMKAAYPDADETFIRGVLGMTNTPESNMVKMRDPKGNIRMIPKDMVDKAKAAGGKVIE
jgi:hypothetical protein